MARVQIRQGTIAFSGAALLLVTSPAAAAPLVEPVMTVTGWTPGIAFTNPRAVAIDPVRGDIVVGNTSAHRIEIFSPAGRPTLGFVHAVETTVGSRVDGLPSGLAVDRTGRIYVVDNLAAYVDVLNPRGRAIARLRLPEGGRPIAVAVTRDGGVMVAEGGNSGRVHAFDADFQPRAVWRAVPHPDSAAVDVQALAELPDGRIVALCQKAAPIVRIFTRDGVFERGFGRVDIGPENFSLPSGVAVTDDGRMWISDEIRQCVQVYQPDGLFLGAVTGYDAGAGDFLYPSAIATDGTRQLVVVERVAGRYRLLRVPSARAEAQR